MAVVVSKYFLAVDDIYFSFFGSCHFPAAHVINALLGFLLLYIDVIYS